MEDEMKISIVVVILLGWSISALSDDSKFSANLFSKFQAKGCTICHDFFEQELKGISFTSHKRRTPDMCVLCHTQEITGFKHADEWFAQPGLYTSGMDSQQTCEATMSSLHAKFKNKKMLARQLETHLFEDPRVLWGIEGATPQSGILPGGGNEKEYLAVNEMERVEPDARGDRRACGEAEHDAAEHQGDQSRQRQPVDRPPPLVKCRALHARGHEPHPEVPARA
jgi:hypothetical protein